MYCGFGLNRPDEPGGTPVVFFFGGGGGGGVPAAAAACESSATLEAGDCLQTLQRRPACVSLIREAVNAAQLCKDLTCL